MSTRHLELVPDNNLVHTAHVFDRAAILAEVKIDDKPLYEAQIVAHHRAPDLYEMIFGTTVRPEMNLRGAA